MTLHNLVGVVWSREEALASVIAAEAVDLPVDGANINYHDQLPPRTGKIFPQIQVNFDEVLLFEGNNENQATH